MTVLVALGLVLLLGLAIFQTLLLFGMSLGEFAWGGRCKVLPKKLRFASAIAILLYAVFALILVGKAALAPTSHLLTTLVFLLAGYFLLGAIMNGLSRSKKERLTMTPIALLLAIIFLLVGIA